MTAGPMQRFDGPVSFKNLQTVEGGIYHAGAPASLVYTNAGAPVSGTTLAGISGPGRLLIDTVNLVLYQNTNTKASPTWTPIGSSTQVQTIKASILAPLPADLISIVAAVTPSNAALTLAAQPPQARKLQIRIVIGTTTTTAITAGNLALVGVDQDGNAISENISLIQNASATVKSAHAYESITSATVSGYAANGSGTGNTVGIGPSNDFGIPCGQGAISGFALLKATKIITTFVPNATASNILWSRAVTDDVAASAVVDAVARTVTPTTAPGAAGINDYEFTCTFQQAD